MATQRFFNNMLNEYRPFDLLRKSLIKQNWFLNNIQKNKRWRGGSLIVPFKESRPNSGRMGSLTEVSNIQRSKYVRGIVNNYKEYWHSLVVSHRDTVDHSGKFSEQSFIKALTEELMGAKDSMNEILSIMLLSGGSMANLTANGTSAGVLAVDRIERFEIDQEFILDDDNSTATPVYVTAIDIDGKTITVSATRNGTALDVSGFTTAQNAKLYYPGAQTATNRFVSFRESILSSANGGSAALYGQTKTANTFLQAPNISGSTMTASTVLESIYRGYNVANQKCRKGARNILMDYALWALAQSKIQADKAPFNVMKSTASEYGWTEISVGSNTGVLKFTAVQQMDRDVVYFHDPRSYIFHTNEFIRPHADANGDKFYTIRATNGYSYVCDMFVFGEFIMQEPARNAVLHSIPQGILVT